MKLELIDAIKSIKDPRLIKDMILNMNCNDVTQLIALSEFVDDETQTLWLDIYSRIMSGKID